MSVSSVVAVFVICSLITYFYRAFPFVFFSRFAVPSFLERLRDLMPSAFMAILVVYCLKAVPTSEFQDNLFLFCGCAVTVAVHLWKRNTILSVFAGTAVYMVLLNLL